MLRLVSALALALTLGTGTRPTQAFVVAPQHRLAPHSCTRGCNSAPGPLRDGDGSAWSCGRERRGYALPPRSRSNNVNVDVSMRAGRAGRGGRHDVVEIEGAGGETRRVQRRSRRPDLRSMQRIGLQAAAAVVVQQDQGVDVQAGVYGEEDQEAQDAMEKSLADKYEAAQGLRERQMMEKEQTGTVQDKYTKIYVPVDGIVIKKTYGFWTWQVFGFIFVQHFVRNIIRKGGSLKKTSMDELNWDHIVTEPEHLLELKAYCCEECGYTLFPARGRHEVFFDEVEDFKCPECEAPRSAFYDANDKDDPHNQKRNEALEAKAAATGADGKGGNGDDDSAGGGVTSSSASAGAPSSGSPKDTKSPSATTTSASGSAPANSTPEHAPPESTAGETSTPPPNPPNHPPGNGRPDGDDDNDADDLLDF